MDVQLLEDIGLTNAQACAYVALVKNGASQAPAIAALIGESRSNAYKLLDKLCELGLATKDTGSTKVHYYPTSPAALEHFVAEQANAVQLRERKLQAAMPKLLDYFFAHSEQASIRYFQGKTGMQQIYSEMLQTGQPLHLLRSPDDLRFYDKAFFDELRKKRRILGIPTISITPDVPSANHDPEIDRLDNVDRTWIAASDYTAPVEWNVAGDKVAFISFGEEAVGILIQSPQIAESFRQIFQLTKAAVAKAPRVRASSETEGKA